MTDRLQFRNEISHPKPRMRGFLFGFQNAAKSHTIACGVHWLRRSVKCSQRAVSGAKASPSGRCCLEAFRMHFVLCPALFRPCGICLRSFSIIVFLIPVRYPLDIQMPFRYHSDTNQIPFRYQSDTKQIPFRYQSDTSQIPIRHSDTIQIPFRYQSDTIQIPVRYQSDTFQIPVRYQSDTN